MSTGKSDRTGWPSWVPRDVHDYLGHTCNGRSLRSVARASGCDASTVLRRVRRIEGRRDDPLIDLALARLGGADGRSPVISDGRTAMTALAEREIPDDTKLENEGLRILTRLAEPGASLALAEAMETAVVVRDTGDGPVLRTAAVARAVAEAMALSGWVERTGGGRVLRYRISSAGRAELKRLVAEAESRRAGEQGCAAAASAGRPFEMGEARGAKAARYAQIESPLVALSRRRDRNGEIFLAPDLAAAGERLREDFELARTGARQTGDFTACPTRSADDLAPPAPAAPAASLAAHRVSLALATLGPGLGDVAFSCCCRLEGLESLEKRMGWSARSGKIVLRIALERLKAHYDAEVAGWSPLIG